MNFQQRSLYSDSSSDEDERPTIVDHSQYASFVACRAEEPPADDSSTASNDTGVPEDIKRQLVGDIQAAGGLSQANLKKICDDNTTDYGIPSSKQRRQVQNQVARWKTYQKQQFLDYLIVTSTNRLTQPASVPSASPAQHQSTPRTAARHGTPRPRRQTPTSTPPVARATPQ